MFYLFKNRLSWIIIFEREVQSVQVITSTVLRNTAPDISVTTVDNISSD